MMNQKEIPQDKILVSEISKDEWRKIQSDLEFIRSLTDLAQGKGCRLIISGGYATDGALGKITRPHGDIDIQIYGNEDEAGKLISELIAELKANLVLPEIIFNDKERQEFYHSFSINGKGIGADIYYLQVVNDPFADEKIIVKKDGSLNETQSYDTLNVKLENIRFEAVNPTTQLVDILYKREIRGDVPKPKHYQDIVNLRLITDPEVVKSRLSSLH